MTERSSKRNYVEKTIKSISSRRVSVSLVLMKYGGYRVIWGSPDELRYTRLIQDLNTALEIFDQMTIIAEGH
jgi:hypothetical protein